MTQAKDSNLGRVGAEENGIWEALQFRTAYRFGAEPKSMSGRMLGKEGFRIQELGEKIITKSLGLLVIPADCIADFMFDNWVNADFHAPTRLLRIRAIISSKEPAHVESASISAERRSTSSSQA